MSNTPKWARFPVNEVMFESLSYKGTCNGRLIMEVSYLFDGSTTKEIMFIHNDGKYHFFDGNILKKVCDNSKTLQEWNRYNFLTEKLLKLANRWCESLGLPELTEEI